MREASIKAGLSESMVGKVVGGNAPPGLVFYRGISKAFGLPLVEVLIRAGEIDARDLSPDNLNAQYARLPEWQQRMVLRFIESLTQEDQSANPPILIPPPKPGTTP